MRDTPENRVPSFDFRRLYREPKEVPRSVYPACIFEVLINECYTRDSGTAARDAHQWQPAIPHLDDRFHRHRLETNITGSTPHAARDAHHWHDTTSTPAIPHLDARLSKPLQTPDSSRTIKSSHSPSRRSIPELIV